MVKTTKTYNNHILVPKHEKLSEKQKQELLKEHNCAQTELPRIKLHDMAIQDLNPKPGDVFKITRKSINEGTNVFFRVVSNE